MSDTNSTARVLPLTVKQTGYLLYDSTRWMIIRELAKGEALPVMELARRLGCTTGLIGKQLMTLNRLGVAQKGFGRLYSLAPAFRPKDGAIDFGHCVMRLDTPME